jgi:hypothetical protein
MFGMVVVSQDAKTPVKPHALGYVQPHPTLKGRALHRQQPMHGIVAVAKCAQTPVKPREHPQHHANTT